MSEIEKRGDNDIVPDGLYGQIRGILETARKRAHAAVNFSMVLAYWEIGRLSVEQQGGAERAEYGKGLIAELSAMLTADFGKGFDESNLAYMRRFHLSFPNLDALRPELSWTHYRKLTAVKNEAARAWYMNAAADAWQIKVGRGETRKVVGKIARRGFGLKGDEGLWPARYRI